MIIIALQYAAHSMRDYYFISTFIHNDQMLSIRIPSKAL